ncbi:MAG TPA: uroporphyrinogen-III C-methyltransferase [Chryseosolibacter sp.]|nr:uroporphyrinogen-III C-methyltransferase [Chryseosolibacter sp.]
MSNKLRIVGAGPGDPELLTLKAVRVLRQAEVLLYDALVHPDVIEHHVPVSCKRTYVGKRKGKKEFSQEAINRLLVFYSTRFENVVRLKGGDPFVFGRGHEELEYAVRNKITVEVIPGISSAVAAASRAGIPLTKRGVSQSFWVVTGSTACGTLSADVVHAARSTATVVVLMGMGHLDELASLFAALRGEDEPVAVIRYATWPEQTIISGSVSDIAERVRAERSDMPGVIVFGKVVNESCIVDAVANRESRYIHT